MENDHFTASVYSDANKPCNQSMTTNAKIGKHGTGITVGPSYQLSYASLPFRAAGKLGGLTLVKQVRGRDLHAPFRRRCWVGGVSDCVCTCACWSRHRRGPLCA